MNPGYFPKLDSGIEVRASWPMPSTGLLENAGARWDEARTPDHGSIYEQRRRAFYDEAIAKLKEHGFGDYPNPYYMIEPEFQDALNNGLGNPAMVDAARRAAPPGYEPGDQFNFFSLRDAWSQGLDQIIINARKTHPDLPDPATFDQKVAEESAATRARAADIGSRATFMGKVGGVAGGAAGTMSRDEELGMTVVTLPIGGVAGSLGRVLLTRLLLSAMTDAALGSVQTGINELADAKFQQQHFGYSKSGEEILGDMAYAAAANALLGVAVQGIGEGAGYLLSRWRSGHSAHALATGESEGALPPFATMPATGPGDVGLVAVGLRAAAEQAQELYSVLPKIGRDAADIADNELQIATTGPAHDLTTHAQNVAQAVEAIANGEQPIPIDLRGRNYFESETTPDGFKLDTTLEVVEFDELKPGSLLNQQVKRDIDTRIAELKSMSNEEIIDFRIKGTLTPEGKPKRGGRTVESHLGQGVHDGFTIYIGNKPTKYINGNLMGWEAPKRRLWGASGAGQQPDSRHLFYRAAPELKPKSASGKYLGNRQRARYESELNVRPFSLEWGVTLAQHDQIIEIKQRIKRLQEEAGLWREPRRAKRKKKPKS